MPSVQPQSERQAWTIGEFAAAFRISRSSIYKAINQGTICSIVVAGRRLIPTRESQRLLEGDLKMSPAREAYFARRKAKRCRKNQVEGAS